MAGNSDEGPGWVGSGQKEILVEGAAKPLLRPARISRTQSSPTDLDRPAAQGSARQKERAIFCSTSSLATLSAPTSERGPPPPPLTRRTTRKE